MDDIKCKSRWAGGTRHRRGRLHLGVALWLAALSLAAASCARVVTDGAAQGSGGNGPGRGATGGATTGASGGFTGRDVPLDGGGALTEDANCGLQDYVLDRRPAIVMLLQDRSTSMRNTVQDATGMSITRWGILAAAVRPVLQQTQSGISWGLKFFPDKAVCGVQPGVNIEPALNNANAITTQLDQIKVVQNSSDNLGLWDGTPTAPALRQAAKYLTSLPTDKQKYIVLATDGQPTCSGGDPLLGGGNPDTDDRASGPAAVTEILQQGIKTAVIGISFSKTWDPANLKPNEVSLNDMAKAGGMPRPTDPAYYAANSSAELAAAFAQITGIVISCTFDLKGRKPPSPDDVAVKIDGTKVPRDRAHAEGWDYDAGVANVVLYGNACDQLKGAAATNNVQIIFGCPGIIIP